MAKQYQSIIRLFEHSGIDTSQEINISRVKKQLAAEFDFSETGFIEIDGHTYNKADVLGELDHPDFAKRLQYHQRIWNAGYVLAMLENFEFNYLEFREQMKAFNGDPAFDQFFSPYFTQSFIYCSRSYLDKAQFEYMGQLLLFEEFILAENREEAFAPLRIFLDDNLKVFRNVNRENYPTFKSRLNIWLGSYWSEMFNQLPPEFYHYKSEFAYFLVNLTVYVQFSHPEDAKAISYELSCMKDIPEELAKTIRSNHAIYTKKQEGNISWGWVIWIVLILLRLAAGC
ncbi:MAG: hypothetical protein QM687_10145 [Ferruginibacter sp.]